MSNIYPLKPTPVDHEIIPVIMNRWSSLAFSSDLIETEKVNQLLEAMRWAPSSYNEQPWRVIYASAEDQQNYSKLADCLVSGNHWAKQAPLLMLVGAKKIFKHNQQPNAHAWYDTGAAVNSLILQATDLGLIAHQMGAFDMEKAQQNFSLPEDISLVVLIALGYPGDVSTLTEDWQKRQNAPRHRQLINEFASTTQWLA